MGDVLFQWKPKIDSNLPVDTLRAITALNIWFDYQMFEAELYKETPYLQGNKVKLSYVI